MVIGSLVPIKNSSLTSGQQSIHSWLFKALSNLDCMKSSPVELLDQVNSSPMEGISRSCAWLVACMNSEGLP